MTITAVVRDFFGTPAGAAVIALFALAALDWVLGTFAAIRDDVFRLDAVGAWLRKHIAGRVLPVTAVLILGHMLGGLSFGSAQDLLTPGTILTSIGLGGAGIYVGEVIGSIRESLTPKPSTRSIPED